MDHTTARFQHDCGSNCFFLGHWFGHDVYFHCGGETLLGGSILARYGDDGPDYGSGPVSIVAERMLNPQHLLGTASRTLPYPEWLFSGEASDCDKAMALGFVELGRQRCVSLTRPAGGSVSLAL